MSEALIAEPLGFHGPGWSFTVAIGGTYEDERTGESRPHSIHFLLWAPRPDVRDAERHWCCRRAESGGRCGHSERIGWSAAWDSTTDSEEGSYAAGLTADEAMRAAFTDAPQIAASQAIAALSEASRTVSSERAEEDS